MSEVSFAPGERVKRRVFFENIKGKIFKILKNLCLFLVIAVSFFITKYDKIILHYFI